MELYFFLEKSLKGLPCLVQKSNTEEKLSKFSENYNFREVFFKKGRFFFQFFGILEEIFPGGGWGDFKFPCYLTVSLSNGVK